MAIKDMAPEGFNDTMRWYAHMTREARMYVQGFALRKCGVWLSVDGVQTMIGYGKPADALAEAEAWAKKQMEKVHQQVDLLEDAEKTPDLIEDRQLCMGGEDI